MCGTCFDNPDICGCPLIPLFNPEDFIKVVRVDFGVPFGDAWLDVITVEGITSRERAKRYLETEINGASGWGPVEIHSIDFIGENELCYSFHAHYTIFHAPDAHWERQIRFFIVKDEIVKTGRPIGFAND